MITAKTDGGPAFPFGQISETTGQPVNGFYDPGMSLRDYFAAKAMQALVSQSMGSALSSDPDTGAQYAYRMADAMLKARETKP